MKGRGESIRQQVRPQIQWCAVSRRERICPPVCSTLSSQGYKVEVLCGIHKEYSREILGDCQVRDLLHAVPNTLELADVERNVVSKILYETATDLIAAC